jgi:hypothetical protein
LCGVFKRIRKPCFLDGRQPALAAQMSESQILRSGNVSDAAVA